MVRALKRDAGQVAQLRLKLVSRVHFLDQTLKYGNMGL